MEGSLRHHPVGFLGPRRLRRDEPAAPQEIAARTIAPAAIDLRMDINRYHSVGTNRLVARNAGVSFDG